MDCSASCCATRPTGTRAKAPRRAKGEGEQERASNGALHFKTRNEYYSGSEIDERVPERSAAFHLACDCHRADVPWRTAHLAVCSSSQCQRSLADDKRSHQCCRPQVVSS